MIFRSPIIGAASGSTGGATFAVDRGVLVMRSRAKPVDRGSTAQAQRRQLMSRAAVAWNSVLAESERQQWRDYAAQTPVTNALGQSVQLTGYAMYIRAALAGNNGATMDYTPSSAPLEPGQGPPFPGASIEVFQSTNSWQLTFDSVLSAEELTWRGHLKISPPRSNTSEQPARNSRVVYGAQLTQGPHSGDYPWLAKEGQICDAYLRAVDAQGRVGVQFWTPVLIEAGASSGGFYDVAANLTTCRFAGTLGNPNPPPGYVGPSIEVRRDSDNTTDDIGFDGTLGLDLQALEDFCGVANGYIRTLYDKSGNANHYVYPTDAAQPLIWNGASVETVNTRPCPTYDGLAPGASLTGTSGTTEAVMMLIEASSDNRIVWDSVAGSARFVGYWLNGNGAASALNAGAPSTRADGSVIGTTRNDVYNAWSTNAAVVACVENMNCFDWAGIRFNSEIPSPGSFSDLYVFSSLSSADRNAIEAAMLNYWNP